MSEKEKKNKSANETLKIIEEIFDYNKNAQRFFSFASEVDKGKSEPTPEESIAKRVKLRRETIPKIEKEEKNKQCMVKKHFTIYQSPSDMYKKLCETEGTGNEDQVYLIKEKLNKIKKDIESVFKNRKF